MSKAIARTDTLPWFKQFWPWFLILLPASVVVAALSTVYIANRHADDLVVDDYYKDGLAINRELDKIERAALLGVRVNISVQDGRVRADVEGPVTDARLSLRLSHPIEADRDLDLVLLRTGEGLYTTPLPAAVKSRWHWLVQSEGADAWRVDGILQPGDFADARPD